VSTIVSRRGKERTAHLTRTRTENDTEPVLVVPSSGHVHHLDGAASQTESLKVKKPSVVHSLGTKWRGPRSRCGKEGEDVPWATSNPGAPS
jgi:hypothetical protein